MVYYFDSSVAVKRYAPETGSEWVSLIFSSENGNTVYLCQIGIVEIAAALSKKVRTRELSSQEYETALGRFLTDVQSQEYFITPLDENIIDLAVDLTKRRPLRGYDAVHLASALAFNTTLLDADLPVLVFASSDRILLDAAKAEGLAVHNPSQP